MKKYISTGLTLLSPRNTISTYPKYYRREEEKKRFNNLEQEANLIKILARKKDYICYT